MRAGRPLDDLCSPLPSLHPLPQPPQPPVILLHVRSRRRKTRRLLGDESELHQVIIPVTQVSRVLRPTYNTLLYSGLHTTHYCTPVYMQHATVLRPAYNTQLYSGLHTTHYCTPAYICQAVLWLTYDTLVLQPSYNTLYSGLHTSRRLPAYIRHASDGLHGTKMLHHM